MPGIYPAELQEIRRTIKRLRKNDEALSHVGLSGSLSVIDTNGDVLGSIVQDQDRKGVWVFQAARN